MSEGHVAAYGEEIVLQIALQLAYSNMESV